MYNGATRTKRGVHPLKKERGPSFSYNVLAQFITELYTCPICGPAWYLVITKSAGTQNVEDKNAATTLANTCNSGPS